MDLSLSVSGGNESRSNSVRVRASNTGLEDVAGATIELLAAAPDGTGPGLISTQEVGLLSGATVEPRFTWVPRSQGTWVIFARVRARRALVAEASSTVDIGSAGQPSPERIVTITAGSDGAMVIPVLVVTFALVVGVIAGRPPGPRRRDHEAPGLGVCPGMARAGADRLRPSPATGARTIPLLFPSLDLPVAMTLSWATRAPAKSP